MRRADMQQEETTVEIGSDEENIVGAHEVEIL